MSYDRWRDEENARWGNDRERHRRDASDRGDHGRGYDKDFGRQYGQDEGRREDAWRNPEGRNYGRESRDEYGARGASRDEPRSQQGYWGRDELGSADSGRTRTDYYGGSFKERSDSDRDRSWASDEDRSGRYEGRAGGRDYGGRGYGGGGYGASGYGAGRPGYGGTSQRGNDYRRSESGGGSGRSRYGSSDYGDSSRPNYTSGESDRPYSDADYESAVAVAWSAGLAEWPAPIADWRNEHRTGIGGYGSPYGDRARSGYASESYSDRDRSRHASSGYASESQRGASSDDSQRWREHPQHSRGWWDRTKDEVRAWMGDEEAEQRRRSDESEVGYHRASSQRSDGHFGRGPKGYARSDQRILEDVSDKLTEDWRVDASDIEVTVNSAEVTLSGQVDSREAKRRAEHIAADVSGVRDVQNNLRVRAETYQSGNLTGSSSAALEQTTGSSSAAPQTTNSTAKDVTTKDSTTNSAPAKH